jgi:hypothetical protein
VPLSKLGYLDVPYNISISISLTGYLTVFPCLRLKEVPQSMLIMHEYSVERL